MKLSKNFSIKKIFFILTIIVLGLVAAPLALAQNVARVYFQPVSSENGLMTVDVIAENVTDMYGAEFRLKYDPAVVAVQDVNSDQEGVQIEPGTLLPAGKGFIVANEVDEAEGTITFAMTLLNPAPAATGSGPLARVNFNILQSTPSTLDVEHVKLVSRDLQTIESQTEALDFTGEPGAAGGSADTPSAATGSTAAAADATGFPWWIIAAAILVLGGLALGGLVLVGGMSASSTGRKPQTNKRAGRQSAPTGGARPSAFKQQSFPPDASQKPR